MFTSYFPRKVSTNWYNPIDPNRGSLSQYRDGKQDKQWNHPPDLCKLSHLLFVALFVDHIINTEYCLLNPLACKDHISSTIKDYKRSPAVCKTKLCGTRCAHPHLPGSPVSPPEVRAHEGLARRGWGIPNQKRTVCCGRWPIYRWLSCCEKMMLEKAVTVFWKAKKKGKSTYWTWWF